MQRHRTFIAVPVSRPVREAASRVVARLHTTASDAKWVEPENLHWTLQFLGDVDDLGISAVCNAVAIAAAGIEPFDLVVRGVGAFPSADRPRTLWLGAGEGAQSMIELQAAIQNQLDPLGYQGEQRRYVPHITLGRAGRSGPSRSLADELAQLSEFEAGSMLVDEVTVYASKLKQGGPVYEALAQMPLSF
jgi:RNA 2',3'-cyclic 3'-phosphodiesterase